MGRKVKDTSLQSRESRRALKQRDAPYWRSITEGLHIGYRKGSRCGAWRVRLFADGRYVKHVLGLADDVLDADGTQVLSWSQAQEAAQAFGRDRRTRGAATRGPLTIPQAIERYVEWFMANRKASGFPTVDSVIRVHILPTFRNGKVASLTSDELRAWQNRLATSPRGMRVSKLGRRQEARQKPQTEEQKRARKATANRALAVFKAILNRAFNDDLVASDTAWRRVKPFGHTDPGVIRYLKTDESIRLVNACPPDLRALVRGALYTGARYGELARLTVNDVDVEEGRIYISPAAKSGKSRHIPLSAEGVRLFADLVLGRDGKERVFLKADGKTWEHNHHMRAFLQANAVARISPPARFHDLRHSYATMLANIPGNTLDVLAEILGHSDTRITRKHYAFLFDDTKKRAVVNMPSLGYESMAGVHAINLTRHNAG